MGKLLSVGVIGCGVIGKTHANAVSAYERTELIAMADTSPEARTAAKEQFPDITLCQSTEDLLALPNLDAVVVALPTGIRAPIVMQVLEAGKHVLIEKPAAMNAGELQQIMDAVPAGITAGVASGRMRTLSHAPIAAASLKEKPIGPLRQLRARGITTLSKPPENSPPVWRLRRDLNGGGILVNWGVYDLDYLLGTVDWQIEPETITASCWNTHEGLSKWAAEGSNAEVHVIAHVECKNGIILSLDRGEFLSCPPESSWEIIGRNGSLRLPLMDANPHRLIRYDATENGAEQSVIFEGEEGVGDGHPGILQDFADAVLDNRPPITTLEQSMIIQRLLDGIHLAATSGKPVRWEQTAP